MAHLAIYKGTNYFRECKKRTGKWGITFQEVIRWSNTTTETTAETTA